MGRPREEGADRKNEALDALADQIDGGHLMLATGGLDLITTAAEQIARLTRERDEARGEAETSRRLLNASKPALDAACEFGEEVARLRARAEQAEAERDRLREALGEAADELSGAAGLTPGDQLKIEDCEQILKRALGDA